MNKTNVKTVKTTEQVIKERKEKRRIKTDRFIAKLEKIEVAKSAVVKNEAKRVPAVKGRQNTVSIALPCSTLENCLTMELKCYLASMIARCAAIFGIDEVVIFNDSQAAIPETEAGNYALLGRHSHSAVMLASILQYLECPPYIRRLVFPNKIELETALRMNPLNIPHHKPDHSLFREGIVSSKPPKPGKGSYVNVGVQREILVDRFLEEGVRVTIQLDETREGQKKLHGKIVSPRTPRLEHSIYWGYSVRIAKSFGQIFHDSPHGGKYDLTIGAAGNGAPADLQLKSFDHALIVFGGLGGLEAILENDESVKASDPSEFFDVYLSPSEQGSRTIRTEEAIFTTLAALQSKLL